ncbi:sensor histidine kinase [Paenibacillus eucommiae]|uniref:Two-component system sensor histidine kinase YesM n=1 Tax=Paenibacillus eucommiae TaxID=1355755 RepID=A0ABS4J4U5_9BACL|nr:histidine kinase [Paenibacillus eucommiae]MBP1994121.1 two-component system sensor histidine kinase YesM [Paenibacillus eucommiae]
MWTRLKLNNTPIFTKVIIIFLIIVMPLFTLSLVLNELGKREVKSQISHSISTTIHYYFVNLEKEIERVIRAQKTFVNDEDLLKLSSVNSILSAYQRTKAINDLTGKLIALKDSSSYIKNITIYIESLGGVVTTSHLMDQPGIKEEMEAISLATYSKGIPITPWNDRLYLNLTYPTFLLNKDNDRKSPVFIQNIELSEEALVSALTSFPQEGGALLFNANWSLSNHRYTEALEPVRKFVEHRKGPSFSMEQVKVGKENYMVVIDSSAFLDATLVFYFPENLIVGQLKTYGTWFWLLVGSSLIIVILFAYGIYLLIQRPLQMLVRRFRNVEEGNFNAVQMPLRADEFGYLFTRFDHTIKRLRTLIDELYVQKIRLQQSELKQLQMQIAPHFLYNSFYMLHRLIKHDDNRTAELVSKNLGDYFQFITRNRLEEVALKDEVNHVRSYVVIQNIRFSNRIEVTFADLPRGCEDIKIPRLILQPLVENAYEHGLGETVAGGQLQIGFEHEPGKLYFIVKDNGAGMAEPELQMLSRQLDGLEEGETTGLVNIQRRLKLRYADRGGLEVLNGEEKGLIVRICIPTDYNHEGD